MGFDRSHVSAILTFLLEGGGEKSLRENCHTLDRLARLSASYLVFS